MTGRKKKSNFWKIWSSHIQSFLGTTGYYRKFILNYAHISIELTNATRKSAPNVVRWSTAMNDEFYNLCHTLSQVPYLTIPPPHRHIHPTDRRIN